MIRWQATIVLSFLASLIAASCCDDPAIKPPSTGGNGGEGGGGLCDPGYTLMPCSEDMIYVALFDLCPEGTTDIPLLQCDSCACATDNVPCTVSGEIHDSGTCMNNPPIEFMDVSACKDDFPNITSTYIKASVSTGECVAAPGEPALGACRVDVGPESWLQCTIDEVCVANWMPICVLMDAGVDCPAGFLPDQTIEGIQQGGTCGCDCIGADQCPQEVHVYNEHNCTSMPELSATADGTCREVVGSTGIHAVAAPVGPQCNAIKSPSGGTNKKLCCLNAF